MQTSVSFSLFGLDFEATGDFEPEVPARLHGHPDSWEEGEGAYFEFHTLTCDGKDAIFLTESSLLDDLINAAAEAADDE